MCVIHWRPDSLDEIPDPAPRPRPQLKWAIPIDIAELGASLEGYRDQLPVITTLRLCHRFGEGALSQLPQEILDHIVSDVHRAAAAAVQLKWKQAFACFQGRCSRAYHSTQCQIDNDELWIEIFGINSDNSEDELDPNDYTAEEKAEMIDDYERDYGYESWPEWQVYGVPSFYAQNRANFCRIWDAHFEGQNDWANMLCTCNNRKSAQSQFAELNDLLKTQFGIESIVLHEVLSNRMTNFLPDIFIHSECSYHTSAFITLRSIDQTESSSTNQVSTHGNITFLEDGNHHAFCQVIDPKQLILGEEHRLRFARAMRILGLNPHYRLTELDSVINSRNPDPSLWEICYSQVFGCPKPGEGSRKEKQGKLEKYLLLKSKELAKQPWPQLMNLAASDTVSPN